jgi:alpha-tubulin N-acetyltransferase 1
VLILLINFVLQAQNLNVPITSWEKFCGSNHQLVLCTSGANGIVGYVKFGQKDLYFYDKKGKVHSKTCDCVLDFYVEDSCQRQGIGIKLFRRMLAVLDVDPCVLAYDRPSPKLIAFMSKYFGLCKPDLQPNRFAIFEGFSFT